MQTLTIFLHNIMNSTLLGLPREIKELIYFDALSHAANKILVSPYPHPVIIIFFPLFSFFFFFYFYSTLQALSALSPEFH